MDIYVVETDSSALPRKSAIEIFVGAYLVILAAAVQALNELISTFSRILMLQARNLLWTRSCDSSYQWAKRFFLRGD